MFHLKLTINADCEHLQIDYAFCPPCTVFEGLFKVTST